jgi:hypothetical protein
VLAIRDFDQRTKGGSTLSMTVGARMKSLMSSHLLKHPKIAQPFFIKTPSPPRLQNQSPAKCLHPS